jgi:hypothetical protein
MSLTLNSKTNTWQEECTLALIRCLASVGTSPETGRDEWAKTRATLLEERAKKSRNPRIIIADADFSKKSLVGFDFSRCYIIRITFILANLEGCNFSQAICRESDFTHANLNNADALVSDFNGCKLNIATPPHQIRNVRRWLAERIHEEQYLADIAITKRSRLVRIWDRVTNYGSRLSGLFAFASLAILLFGLLYFLFQDVFGIVVTTAHDGFFGMIAFSALNFLGASPQLSTGNALISWITVVNVALGVAAIGIFIAILAQKLIARLR